MIKAVLFDLDGTLINTNNLILQSFRYAFKAHLNKEIVDSEIIKLFGKPLNQAMGQYDVDNIDTLITFFREFNEARHDDLATAFQGVEECLKTLTDRGIKLAVVTSKRRVMTLRSLKLIDAFKYMDVVITPEDTEKHKPEAEPALKACSALGINPKEAVMVGDSIYDIQCGANAGCLTCAVTYSSFPMEELMECSPDFVVENLLELPDILEEINKKAV